MEAARIRVKPNINAGRISSHFEDTVFQGFRLFIPILLVILATFGLGGILTLSVWFVQLLKDESGGSRRISPALVVFTASVIALIVGCATASFAPEKWSTSDVFGEPFGGFVVLSALMVSLVCEIFTIPLTHRFPGRGNGVLRVGSWALIAINGLAMVLYWLEGPGMPLH